MRRALLKIILCLWVHQIVISQAKGPASSALALSGLPRLCLVDKARSPQHLLSICPVWPHPGSPDPNLRRCLLVHGQAELSSGHCSWQGRLRVGEASSWLWEGYGETGQLQPKAASGNALNNNLELNLFSSGSWQTEPWVHI